MTDEEKTREQLILELEDLRERLSEPAPGPDIAGRGLAESSVDYRCLFENSLDAILLTLPDGTVTAANPAALAMFGLSKEEIIRVGHRGLIDPSDPYHDIALEERLGSGKLHRELNCIRKDGTKFPAEVSSVIIEGGKKAFVIFRDISARKKAKEELKAAYEKLSETLESITDGFCSVDREWRFTFLNKTGAEAFGRKREELVGGNIWELFPDAEDRKIYAEAHRAVETGIPVHFEEFYPEPLSVWFEFHVYPSSEGLSIYYRNITERMRVREDNSTLAAIVESSDDAIVGKALDGRIMTWNRGAEKIYGYTVEEVVGQPISILIPEDRHDEILTILQRISRAEVIDHHETVRLRKDGQQIHVSLTVSPIRDASGKIMGASTIARDVSERKQMETELCKAYDELEMRVQQRTMELREKSKNLEEVNTALRVLLKQREEDKKEFGESILANVRNLIAPYVDKLKNSNLSSSHATLVDILESHLSEITSSFSRTLALRHAALTPTEMRIAAFIRDGKPTTDIAEILCISEKTVACHRANIRQKLGLQGGRNNLRSYLLNIS